MKFLLFIYTYVLFASVSCRRIDDLTGFTGKLGNDDITRKSDGLFDPRHYETPYQHLLKNPSSELLKFARGDLYDRYDEEGLETRSDLLSILNPDYFSKHGSIKESSYDRKAREDQPPPYLYPRYGR
ncbi:hypothetical protein TrispH2_005563 [Trichoplax sp. H2]|nr:hypothetical protein TrispH2_005563 [Trichoplax sp. H2]|eukprot:RDD41142.1 hypothetical protein TrispH2_005563 [Trichoplax sp. H2]